MPAASLLLSLLARLRRLIPSVLRLPPPSTSPPSPSTPSRPNGAQLVIPASPARTQRQPPTPPHPATRQPHHPCARFASHPTAQLVIPATPQALGPHPTARSCPRPRAAAVAVLPQKSAKSREPAARTPSGGSGCRLASTPQNRPATPHRPQPPFVRFGCPNLESAIT